MPYESEKLKSRVFYYLCMVLAGCILANIVLRCDRNLQVFILPFTDSSRLAGVSVQQTLFYVLLQRTKQVAVVYLLYKVFPPKAVFSIGMSALLFLFGFVISCQMFYLGLSGVWFLLLCLFLSLSIENFAQEKHSKFPYRVFCLSETFSIFVSLPNR